MAYPVTPVSSPYKVDLLSITDLILMVEYTQSTVMYKNLRSIWIQPWFLAGFLLLNHLCSF